MVKKQLKKGKVKKNLFAFIVKIFFLNKFLSVHFEKIQVHWNKNGKQ